MKSVYEHFQREADIFDGEGYVPLPKPKPEQPTVKAWITQDVNTEQMLGGTDMGIIPIHPSYVPWFKEKLFTEIEVEVINAKVFGSMKVDGTYYCDYCCNGDRCDDASHVARHKCPHCKGTGSIGTNKYIIPAGTATKLAAISKDVPPSNALKNMTRRQGENKIIKEKVDHWNPQTREEWMTLVIPDIVLRIKEFNKELEKENI